MRSLLSLIALFVLVACSGASRPEGSSDSTDGVTRDDGGSPTRGDGPTTVGDSDKPARPGTTAPQPGKPNGPEFVECADTRVDAERGPRGSNVVWVVDNSGSMDEEARAVQDNLNRFAQAIASGDLVDYRVVLITERDFVQVPNPLGSDATHFLHVEEDVGSEEPLSDLLARFNDFSDFLLPGVVTHFVVVTDDESEIPAQQFVTNMTMRLGSDFRVHSIASPPGDMPPPEPTSPFDFDDDDDDDEGCSGAFGAASAQGIEHWEASRLTNGLTFSICTEDWSALFSELAKKVGETAAVPCTVELPEPPPGQSLSYGQINVLFTPPGMSDGDAIPKVDGASACTSKSAWYYDDPQMPTRILLCPDSCAAAGRGGSLQIALGCDTLVQ